MKSPKGYVSLKVARLLKKKGFNEPCNGIYNEITREFKEDDVNKHKNSESSIITIPTFQEATQWLRESHTIDIKIDADITLFKGIRLYTPYVIIYQTYWVHQKDCMSFDDNGTRWKKKTYFIPEEDGHHKHYEEYEMAMNEAIKLATEKI